MRMTALFVLALSLAGQPRAEFEVASIKPSNAPEGSSTWNTAQGNMRMLNFSVRRIILTAYQLSDAQLIGGPKWIDSERYDINARPPGPVNTNMLLEMTQSLLADRFKLKFHRERRDVAGYALVIAKGGMKIQPIADEGQASSNGSNAKIEAKMIHMSKLGEMLTRELRVPVVDQTGAEGAFTFTLEWAPNNAKPDSTLPSLFTAIQETLGLKLEARKVAADVLVVESVEKPDEN